MFPPQVRAWTVLDHMISMRPFTGTLGAELFIGYRSTRQSVEGGVKYARTSSLFLEANVVVSLPRIRATHTHTHFEREREGLRLLQLSASAECHGWLEREGKVLFF